MRSSARNRLTKQPYWFLNNGVWFYGFLGSETTFGSVSWKRYAATNEVRWVAGIAQDFDAYREFDDEATAKAYVEAIIALTFD